MSPRRELPSELPEYRTNESERSTFLQEMGESGPTTQICIGLAALLIALGAGLHQRSYVLGFVVAIGSYLGLCVLYDVVARFLGWPRIRWMSLWGDIVNFLSLFG